MPTPATPAIVLLSGGLDSATVLALMRRDGFAVHALSFDYGQRHKEELHYAALLAQSMGVASHRVVPIDLAAFGGSALTDPQLSVPETGLAPGIPITYVPARNTVFLSLALALAEVLNARDIFLGVNSQDYSGYPDCRPEFVQAFEALAQVATRLGDAARGPRIHAPLQFLNKSEIIHLGSRLGVDYGMTRSCYQLDAEGRSCGRCDSCRLRREGFQKAGIADPTPYQGS
ncbi:7-cyano-7-deazaguanine synthase QueC [Acidithiobacillus sp.]|jgi:7-cyano-7-deazaguanine synthase|uniref:7-cyano-7-deazaguanine synthase QueC n=1 Tax=Acidithiobacillus sp. TaxID=1872118 RepID=UPI0025BD3BDF|nr:7-cyano-7-deazaguanine synthase QueC [Acidithiobacillus sp.]MCK9187945.1 7-cyano-7-deazaguanine synthase QueC [Acidithiobacillus sp.]MCK9359904.1 7-cyano-7-deazaguanine synthase QueC [Acidithiobacillus sp.]